MKNPGGEFVRLSRYYQLGLGKSSVALEYSWAKKMKSINPKQSLKILGIAFVIAGLTIFLYQIIGFSAQAGAGPEIAITFGLLKFIIVFSLSLGVTAGICGNINQKFGGKINLFHIAVSALAIAAIVVILLK